jgi:hypothetical protein
MGLGLGLGTTVASKALMMVVLMAAPMVVLMVGLKAVRFSYIPNPNPYLTTIIILRNKLKISCRTTLAISNSIE